MESCSFTGLNYFTAIVYSHKRKHLRGMSLRASLVRKTFHFSFDARTSRGTMRDRTSWFFRFHDDKDPEITGVGECAPLPGLSKELNPEFEGRLNFIVNVFNEANLSSFPTSLNE